MKILHVIHRFLPEAVAGGTTTYLLELCRRQSETHEVAVLAGGPPRAEGDFQETIECEGIPVWKVHPRRQHWYWCGRNAFVESKFRETVAAFQPDIVHFHSLALLSNRLPAMAARLKTPTVFTLHDAWFVCLRIYPGVLVAGKIEECDRPSPLRCAACLGELLDDGRGTTGYRGRLHAVRSLLFAAVERPVGLRRTFASVGRFLAPSRYMRAYFVRHGFPGDRVCFVPYGIDVDKHRAVRRNPGMRPCFGYLGGAHPAKGLELLVEAFRPFEAKAELRVYGAYPADLMQRCESAGARFPGTIGGGAKVRELARLHAIVVPSLFPDNSPLVIHEARAARVPVIGSAVGGIPELVDEGRTGFIVPPGDAEALRERIRRFVDTPTLTADMAKSITPYRQIRDAAAEVEEHYRQVLSERRRRS